MAYVQSQPTTDRTITLADRLARLEREVSLKDREIETIETKKQFKFPFSWRRKFSQAKRKSNSEKMLVFFYNKKNELEPPKLLPVFDGNMIVWKNKPYEFDPRAVWTVKGMKGNPKAYCIKEIDRRPISNLDLDEIRQRGDSTESDEFLIKAALKAQTSQVKKGVNIAVMVVIGLIIVGGLIWFLTSK